jgi:uncharacterized protein (DUF4415 family)
MSDAPKHSNKEALQIANKEPIASRAAFAAQTTTASPKRGRPRKQEGDKYKCTYIRLHPKVLEWARIEAEKRGIGYQSVINETLLEQIIS